MVEIELKFQIDPARRDGVRRALHGRGAQVEGVRLRARYFDTPDERLARAGLALRLRKEGRARWVQTLKGRGDGLVQRLEHEVVLLPGAALAIDIARHDGTPAGQALRDALGDAAAPLLERFATDIRRSRRVVRVRSASGAAASVEVALDEGWLIASPTDAAAGDGQAAGEPGRATLGKPARPVRRRLPVAEIEFELLAGAPQGLIELASRWVHRHNLWLDVRSKAERGQALATGRWPGAVFAQAPLIGRRMRPARAFAAMLHSALAHVLPNMAALAEATHADADHLHQARVALRRLRTLLREFGQAAPGLDIGAAAPLLGEVFSGLGALRDREIIEETLRPAREAERDESRGAGTVAAAASTLQAARVPLAAAETAPLRMPAFNVLLLALLGVGMSAARPLRKRSRPLGGPARSASGAAGMADAAGAPPDRAAEPTAATTVRVLAAQRLSRLHKRVAAQAVRFDALDDEARHALRKRLKRLRYSLEFVAPLFARKAVARYLAVLKPAQQVLGDFNDLVVAQASLRERAEPEAFVRGWLAARRLALEAQAATRLAALADAPRFWKRKKD